MSDDTYSLSTRGNKEKNVDQPVVKCKGGDSSTSYACNASSSNTSGTQRMTSSRGLASRARSSAIKSFDTGVPSLSRLNFSGLLKTYSGASVGNNLLACFRRRVVLKWYLNLLSSCCTIFGHSQWNK